MIGYTSFEILSGNVAAIDLGITSEISIITIVTIADAIPTFTPISIAKIVTSVGKIIFYIVTEYSSDKFTWFI